MTRATTIDSKDGTRIMRGTLTAAVALAMAIGVAAPARADFGIVSFGASATDDSGARASQAGAHPDLRTRFTLPQAGGVADGTLRDVDVELPPGLVGNPREMPVCPNELFYTQEIDCPAETQVGTLRIERTEGSGPPLDGALYRLTPPRGVVARFGSIFAGPTVYLDARLRVGSDGQYRVVASSHDSSVSLPVTGADVTLWGVPADPAHDRQRVAPGNFGWNYAEVPVPSTARRAPLTLAPTSCSGLPLRTTLSVTSWEEPDVRHTAWIDHDFDGFPFINEGCDRLAFDADLSLATTTSAPDAPTGLDVEVDNPQEVSNPDGLATAHLRDVVVKLPAGMSVNPGSADGLQACSDAQLGLGDNEPADCPAASKIGTVTATTPVLEEPLEGGVYIRSQASDDPESGQMFRLALVIENEDRGIRVKLPGSVAADAGTGQLTATFRDSPQAPVDRVQLRLKGGPRAPLATSATCGSGPVGVDVTSWAGHRLGRSGGLTVDCVAGIGGFDPTFEGGALEPFAGASSPFVIRVAKPDGDAAVDGVRIELPRGSLATLKGNVGSQVGTVRAYSGPGSNPFVLPGKLFLEGRYGDAPFSLRAAVPAKAGPFDLGEVVVRQKIYVDPDDASVTVVSDPLPTIVKGVPVRLQRLDVDVDKPGFMLNPTSCRAKEIKAVLGSADGHTAQVVNRFRMGGCSELAFKPKLAMRLSGKRQTRTGGHPALRAVLTQGRGQSGVDRAKVTLPSSVALDPDNAQALCEFEDGTKADLDRRCPKGSIVGRASAVTPVLNRPLSGNVYFVKNVERNPRTGALIRKLPMIVVALRGEVSINLVGKSSTTKAGRLVATFGTVPDAPVSKFTLHMAGGSNGILVVTRTRKSKIDLCASKQVAGVETDGHNGKRADFTTAVKTPCAQPHRTKAGQRKKR